MKILSVIERLSFAAALGLGVATAVAVDGTLLGPENSTQAWLTDANWSGGSYPGEINNAGSLNPDLATIANASLVTIDFSAPGANGQLTLGAIIVSRTNNSTTVRPSSGVGTLTLNGDTVNGSSNTILSSLGRGFGGFSLGDSTAMFTAVRLGGLTNVIQVASGKVISIGSVISERTADSGIIITSDTGQALGVPGGVSAYGQNTFSGPVRIENGMEWNLANASQSLGLSPPNASNLTLDNGALSGSSVRIGRLFTLGPGGGRLFANLGTTESGPFAFTNTGAISFEGSGARSLTLSGRSTSLGGRAYGALSPSLSDAPGGGVTSLIQTDYSLWTLTGSNTYSGTTTIYDFGVLELKGNGSIANSPVITVNPGDLKVSGVTGGANFDGVRFALANGQTLTGNIGGVRGAMDVPAGAAISPGVGGVGIGELATDDIIFTSPNALLDMEVSLAGGMAADYLRVFGGLDLGGATLRVTLLDAPATSAASQTFLLIWHDGSEAITNQFGTVNLVGSNADRYQVSLDYAFNGTDELGRVGNGNDLAITLTPAIRPSSFSLSISVTNGIATLTWPSVSNQTYWVQYKNALTNANWDDLPGEVIATGSNASKTDTTGTKTRFYRVKTQ